jgi:pimeloyl-ACP methyl ester carboxylesterase
MRAPDGRVLSYYDDRRVGGRPLVLVHSLNACASAYEMRPLFEHYRTIRPVYALDLAGFGFSERGPLSYTPESYTAELIAFLARVKDREGDAPDVVALSSSCELVARAAAARKDLVHLFALLSPTGLGRREKVTVAKIGNWAGRLSASHALGRLAFLGIASRPSIRHFLGKSFVGAVDSGLRDYAYSTSHQPGAEYAPLAFLSRSLATPNIFDTYASLDRPALVIYDRDPYVTFERLRELEGRSSLWSSKQIVPSRGMPQFDRPGETVAALDQFWKSHAQHRQVA